SSPSSSSLSICGLNSSSASLVSSSSKRLLPADDGFYAGWPTRRGAGQSTRPTPRCFFEAEATKSIGDPNAYPNLWRQFVGKRNQHSNAAAAGAVEAAADIAH